MLNICIAIIAVVALMGLGFAIFTISKRLGNKSQNDLVNQLEGISNSIYTDLDQEIVTGARLKQVINQVKTTDCAVLISTLGFMGAQAQLGDSVYYKGSNAKAEATLNGNIAIDMMNAKTPITQIENYNCKTSLNNSIDSALVVNFGSVLKNSITGKKNEIPNTDFQSMVWSEKGTAADLKMLESGETGAKAGKDGASKFVKYDETAEYGQTIKYVDGQFKTKLEFATDENSRIYRYDMTSDLTKTGKTFSIPDTAQFNSYVLTNASGDYMGIVFVQRRK